MSKQRILIVTLFVSLLANAFFIGFGATRLIETREDSRKGGILRLVSARLTENLDDPARQQVAVALEALDPQYQQLRNDRQDNYRKLRALLAEPAPDQPAVSALLLEMREQSSGLVSTVHETAIAAILDLPADQRAQLSEQRQ